MIAKRRTPGLDKKQLRKWYERHGFSFALGPGGEPTRTFFYRLPNNQPALISDRIS
jgi:hypothetical protein